MIYIENIYYRLSKKSIKETRCVDSQHYSNNLPSRFIAGHQFTILSLQVVIRLTRFSAEVDLMPSEPSTLYGHLAYLEVGSLYTAMSDLFPV